MLIDAANNCLVEGTDVVNNSFDTLSYALRGKVKVEVSLLV